MAHAIIRIYANSGPLLDTVREHQARVLDVMRDLPGLQTYTVHGDDASATGVSITVCDDKTSAQESIKRGAALIKELLPDANLAPPRILEGDIVVRLAAQDEASRTGNPHLMLRLYHDALPAIPEHAADLQQALSAVPGWRLYAAFADEATGHGVAVIAADDAASLDKAAEAQRAFGQKAFPEFATLALAKPPEIIRTTRLYRMDVATEATPA
jgi:hypothetical protein